MAGATRTVEWPPWQQRPLPELGMVVQHGQCRNADQLQDGPMAKVADNDDHESPPKKLLQLLYRLYLRRSTPLAIGDYASPPSNCSHHERKAVGLARP